jgi:hypothetical protein
MSSKTGRPGLRRALDAFFFGFGQAINVSGSVVNRGRYARGLAGDAKALQGDWRRSLDMANERVSAQANEARERAARGGLPGR